MYVFIENVSMEPTVTRIILCLLLLNVNTQAIYFTEVRSAEDNSEENVSKHLESPDGENQEQIPPDAVSKPEQLLGATCTDEQCSEEQSHGTREEPAGVNVPQFAEPCKL